MDCRRPAGREPLDCRRPAGRDNSDFQPWKIIDGAIVSVLSAKKFTSTISRTLSLCDFKCSKTLSHCFSHCFHILFQCSKSKFSRPTFHVQILTPKLSRPNLHGLRLRPSCLHRIKSRKSGVNARHDNRTPNNRLGGTLPQQARRGWRPERWIYFWLTLSPRVSFCDTMGVRRKFAEYKGQHGG